MEIPAGTFRIPGTITMTPTTSGSAGVGRATTLFFDNGGADCIVVGNHMPPKPPVAAGQLELQPDHRPEHRAWKEDGRANRGGHQSRRFHPGEGDHRPLRGRRLCRPHQQRACCAT